MPILAVFQDIILSSLISLLPPKDFSADGGTLRLNFHLKLNKI